MKHAHTTPSFLDCTESPFYYSETYDKRPRAPRHQIKWSYMTGGLSLVIQMYRNVRSCYSNNGLSS